MNGSSRLVSFLCLLPSAFVATAEEDRTTEQSADSQTLEHTVLDGHSSWRFFAAWRTPATVADGKYDLGGGYTIDPEGTRWIRESFTFPTAPPPPGWMATDFDDSGWARHIGPPFGGYGYGLGEQYQNRFRTLNVDLPSQLLCKGTNVLALELHRAALPARHLSDASQGWNPAVGKNAWGTCGVEDLRVTASVDRSLIANVGRVPDVQVWNCDTLLRPGVDVSHGDPLEPLRNVCMAAPRNGVSSGQIVVSDGASGSAQQ